MSPSSRKEPIPPSTQCETDRIRVDLFQMIKDCIIDENAFDMSILERIKYAPSLVRRGHSRRKKRGNAEESASHIPQTQAV